MSNFDKNAPPIKLEHSPCNSTKFSLLASGARFSKVPIINGSGKLLPFLNTGISVVLHLHVT